MPSSRTRARDADRTATCGALDSAMSDGQLDGAEHRERTATALQAKTLGELAALVDDLQLGRPIPELRQARTRRPARWVGLAVSLVLLAAGFGIGRLTAPASAATVTTSAEAQVDPRFVTLKGLHTPDGFAQLVSDMRSQLGTTSVDRAVVYPDYASVEVAVPGAPARSQSYTYRGGMDGPGTPSSRNAKQPLADVASFDPAVFLRLLAGAPQSLNVTDPTSRYLIFEDDGKGPHVAVYASNEAHEGGYLTARPDGSLIAVHPFTPR
ncbi:DUF1707 domain-containing protein [Pseudonocardia ailaonensis]|uniref:DUF1707 domain-containing protein n=1 Tax=Pseudonocardia ailaonensis TaxID=367279 RepID=A0ABN2NGC0_9PSEU